MMNVNVTFSKQAVGYIIPAHELTDEWRRAQLVAYRIRARIEDAEYDARQASIPLNSQSDK